MEHKKRIINEPLNKLLGITPSVVFSTPFIFNVKIIKYRIKSDFYKI